MNLNFNDFQKQDIKFDVNKLQNAYKELLTIKGFSGVDGVSNFGAISLTQIPVIQTLLKVIKQEVCSGLNQILQEKKL